MWWLWELLGLRVCLGVGSRLVALDLGLVHLEVVLVVVLLLLRSAARLSAVVFRDGLLGGRLALGYGQMLCYALLWIFLQGSYSPMGR